MKILLTLEEYRAIRREIDRQFMGSPYEAVLLSETKEAGVFTVLGKEWKTGRYLIWRNYPGKGALPFEKEIYPDRETAMEAL